jgi:GWxTD domain-containing protein
MKKTIKAFMCGWALWASALALPGQNPPLSAKYAKFLEDVSYISTTKERDVFRRLESDQDRDRFIEEFWAQRDPTPGTPRNEFKEEHYRRMEFADKTFGRGTPFKGSKTERGRIYIILGPPIDMEKVISSDAYPMELWYYAGNPAMGQASNFRLLFFQQYGAGDYRLYNPAGNSPKELVGNPRRAVPRKEDPQDWDEWDAGAFMVIRERLTPEAANAVFSLIPGNTSQWVRNQSSILLAEVQRYPQKKVNDDYVVAILEHKPKVEVSYSVNFIGNRTAMAVLEDPSGATSLHYVLVPDRISFDTFGDKYVTDLKTTLRIADAQGKTLYQQEKTHAIELHKDELKSVSADSFQLYDSVPMIPGMWSLSLLLENTVSREFTTVEKNVAVPPAGVLHMSPLVLARKVFEGASTAGASRAFQLGSLQIYPLVNGVFRDRDRIHAFTQLLGMTLEFKAKAFVEWSLLRDGLAVWSARKAVSDYGDGHLILESVPPESVTEGTYSLRAVLQDEARREVLATEVPVKVIKENLPGIWVAAQTNPPISDPSYDFIRGTQYLNAGEIDKGAAELARAYEKKRDSVEYAIGYARALLVTKSAAKAREILLPLAESTGAGFDLFETLGRAAKESGNCSEAVKWFGKALTARGNVADALNAMGECYLEMGDKDLALKAFNKSLEVNPNQDRIKEIVKGIRRELN